MITVQGTSDYTCTVWLTSIKNFVSIIKTLYTHISNLAALQTHSWEPLMSLSQTEVGVLSSHCRSY